MVRRNASDAHERTPIVARELGVSSSHAAWSFESAARGDCFSRPCSVVGGKAPRHPPHRAPSVPCHARTRVNLRQTAWTSIATTTPISAEPATIASDVWPDAAWSPDGRQLVTKSSDWTQLVLITLADGDGGRRLPVAAPDSVIGSFSWRPLPP